MKLRHWVSLALALATAALLTACGSGGNGSGSVRLVNATTDEASVDLYVDSNSVATGITTGAVGSYVGVSSGGHVIAVNRSNGGGTLSQSQRAINKDSNYTLVAYGSNGAIGTVLMTDSQTAPATGSVLVRVFNSSADAGPLDVYLTTAAAASSLNTSLVTAGNIGSGQFTQYNQISTGTYTLTVTGTGNPSDVRLSVAGLALADQSVLTLILQPSPSGVLVGGLLVAQGGSTTAAPLTSARARVVASVASNTAVSGSVGSTTVANGLGSPTVGQYVLIPTGSQTLTLSAGGTPVSNTGLTAVAGTDYTLLVTGTAAAPTLNIITDDNRLPTVTTQAKMRLINGVASQTSGISLSANFAQVASNVMPGNASSPTLITAGTGYELDINSPQSIVPLYTTPQGGVTIVGQGVYTVFLLDGLSAPKGVPFRER
ncbi:MAG TPA: DUF4397 domain-containing protein [Methylibium sp.]